MQKIHVNMLMGEEVRRARLGEVKNGSAESRFKLIKSRTLWGPFIVGGDIALRTRITHHAPRITCSFP